MIEGEVEKIGREEIRGWAWSPGDSDDRLLVEAFVRGRLRASLSADMARSAGGAGKAGHGFLFEFSRPLSDDDLSAIQIYATAVSGERTRLLEAGRREVNEEGLSENIPWPAESSTASEADLPQWPFPAPLSAPPPLGELRLEIAAGIEQLGRRHFSGVGWVRSRGEALPIRGFAVRAVGPKPPAAIEIKGYYSGDYETEWIGGGEFCGPGEAGGPLIGFAVRATDRRYEAVYHGCFAKGGEIGPCRDGAPCLSVSPADLLTGIRLTVRERA